MRSGGTAAGDVAGAKEKARGQARTSPTGGPGPAAPAHSRGLPRSICWWQGGTSRPHPVVPAVPVRAAAAR